MKKLKKILKKLGKYLPKVALAGGVMALMFGCASPNLTAPEASLTACKSLVHVTHALTQVKPMMSKQTVGKTTMALETAAGYCTMKNPPANADVAVTAILDSLNSLTQIIAEQKGVKK